MKIAMIGQKDVPSRLGGVEVAVEALSVRMAARGHQVTLYNCHRCGLFCKEREKRKRLRNYKGVQIREVRVPDLRGVSAALGSLLATVRALFGGYDCIHYHAEGPSLMLVLPWLFGVPTVATIHGLDWKRSKWGGFASWYLRMGERTAARLSGSVIVLSKAMQQYFADTYGRETVLIPNGMEATEQRAASRIISRWGLMKDGYILYLGRIVPEKGLENLIRAFRAVRTDKKLVIAGGPADTKDFYQSLVKAAALDRRIIFTGFVEGEILEELYSNSYFYCLPSDLEGMPLSLLEAMSYGSCCLCSDIPECTEVMEEVGYLFQRGSISDLTRWIQRLCDQPELVTESRGRIQNAIFGRHDWEKITDSTLMLYRQTTGRKRRKPGWKKNRGSERQM